MSKETLIVVLIVAALIVLSFAIYFACLFLFFPEKATEIIIYELARVRLTPTYISPQESLRLLTAKAVAGLLILFLWVGFYILLEKKS